MQLLLQCKLLALDNLNVLHRVKVLLHRFQLSLHRCVLLSNLVQISLQIPIFRLLILNLLFEFVHLLHQRLQLFLLLTLEV